MLKAVLFDLDGTVIDSEPQHSVVALCMLRERSVDLPEGGLDRYIGIPGSVMWRELRERYSLIESV
ncbi:MAG TPA: hypothetical protein VLH09_03120, partial [Bryobacteraceae bacterium]|nr:hypothetical protein [Bryobacteraceae bacterium]